MPYPGGDVPYPTFLGHATTFLGHVTVTIRQHKTLLACVIRGSYPANMGMIDH